MKIELRRARTGSTEEEAARSRSNRSCPARSRLAPPRGGRSFFTRSLARSPARSLPTYLANHKRARALPVQAKCEDRYGRVAFPAISAYQSAWVARRVKVDKTDLPTPQLTSADRPIKERSIEHSAVMSVRGKQVQNGTYEFDYMRVPDTRTRWEIIRDGIYNPQEGTYCGHPPKKWGKSFSNLPYIRTLQDVEERIGTHSRSGV